MPGKGFRQSKADLAVSRNFRYYCIQAQIYVAELLSTEIESTFSWCLSEVSMGHDKEKQLILLLPQRAYLVC